MECNPTNDPLKCKHQTAYFVDSIGDEYCSECGEWTDICD